MMLIQQKEAARWFRDLGLTDRVIGGVQIDITAVYQMLEGKILGQRSTCNNNCTMMVDGVPTGGNYICPASISLNRGLRPKTMAPAEVLFQGFQNTAAAIRLARQHFFAHDFAEYCEKFRIPDWAAEALRQTEDYLIDANLFGGNSEIKRDVAKLIQMLRESGEFVVALTSTGKRYLTEPEFVEQIIQAQPNVVAVSVDDFESIEDMRWILGLSLAELRKEWKAVGWRSGQRQKLFEAIHLARLANQLKDFPPMLFNMVLHPGNIAFADEMIFILSQEFPNATVNPYPAQTAFQYQPEGMFSPQDLVHMERLVDRIIRFHLGQEPDWGRTTKRLHYWLVMKSIFKKWVDDPAQISRALAGHGVWACYRPGKTLFYPQIGVPPPSFSSNGTHPGGYCGCYWNNQTVTNEKFQAWTAKLKQLFGYLVNGASKLAQQAKNPCPGCGNPRLWLNQISTEQGLSGVILPVYRKERKRVLDF